jgi:hypothetical protein
LPEGPIAHGIVSRGDARSYVEKWLHAVGLREIEPHRQAACHLAPIG